jgi:hypothetical protein
MTESGSAVVQALSMSVEGFSVDYVRNTSSSEPSKPPATATAVQIMMAVKGATVEHHQNKPITRVDILFLEGEFEAGRVGFLQTDPAERDIMLHATLPLADFAGFWAALRLDKAPIVEGLLARDDVIKLRLLSKGTFFP